MVVLGKKGRKNRRARKRKARFEAKVIELDESIERDPDVKYSKVRLIRMDAG